MTNIAKLSEKLKKIDSKDYSAYQRLKGTYDFGTFTLDIEQIPKDPYAPPHTGVYRLWIGRDMQTNIEGNLSSNAAQTAFTDFLARSFHKACSTVSKGRRGTGNSGLITINQPKQVILNRSSVLARPDGIEVRCFIGLPADGRKINASLAHDMFCHELPTIVDRAFSNRNIDINALKRHINTAIDAAFLRAQLPSLGLIAFIANKAILPRHSGDSDLPLTNEKTIPFNAPKSLLIEITLPHAGKIKGLGIREGVTLITGGGYHGKSTLLDTIEAAVYNHIPDDGRHFCVSSPQTVKIQAANGRFIAGTDISPFIQNLPFETDTSDFSTDNASGSTSQAANIMEALEIGATVILMDEDTCATNFMIRDQKMQSLVSKKDEPITPFIDRVNQLYTAMGVSTILVLGGVGDYFDVADTVIQMKQYEPFDVTEKARLISDSFPNRRKNEATEYLLKTPARFPLGHRISSKNQYGKRSLYAKESGRIIFGQWEIDLWDMAHLVELSQTKTIGQAIEYAKQYMDGHRSLKEVVSKVIDDIESAGLDVISDRISGEFVQIRPFELAFAINRLRSLEVLSPA